MNMEVMPATKENNTVGKEPKKTDCIKPSDEQGDSDDAVRCSTESVQQEKQESHRKSTFEANLPHPSHKQTLCLTDETPQSKAGPRATEQGFSFKRRTVKKHADRKRESLGFSQTHDMSSSNAYASTADKPKSQSVSQTAKASLPIATTSSMERYRAEEGTSNKQPMRKSSKISSNFGAGTSDKNKSNPTPLPDHLFGLDNDEEDGASSVSEENAECNDSSDDVESDMDYHFTAILYKCQEKAERTGKHINLDKYIKHILKIKNNINSGRPLVRVDKPSKLKQDKRQEKPMTENITSDDDNNNSDTEMMTTTTTTTEPKKKKLVTRVDDTSKIDDHPQTSIHQTRPFSASMITDAAKKKTKANMNVFKRSSAVAPQPSTSKQNKKKTGKGVVFCPWLLVLPTK